MEVLHLLFVYQPDEQKGIHLICILNFGDVYLLAMSELYDNISEAINCKITEFIIEKYGKETEK